MTNKYLIAVVLLVVAGGVFGGYKFLFSTPKLAAVGTSTAGSTGRSATQANIYGVNLAAPGANATSSSLLNSSANDYYITALKAGCENLGTSQTAYSGGGIASNGLTVSVATSSTAAPATNGNANVVGGGTFALSTTTGTYVVATSTALGGNTKIYGIWAAGSYLTFTVNATNTAVCTFGADYTTS